MTVYYLDSSAWLKRYFAEPGARRIADLFARRVSLACSPLGYVEVMAGLARQYGSRPTTPDAEPDLLNAFESHWRELLKVEIDEAVFHMPEPSPGKNGCGEPTLFIWPPLIPSGRASPRGPFR